MVSEFRWFKCDRELSALINSLQESWKTAKQRACALSVQYGGRSNDLYTKQLIDGMCVTGFVFDDESRVNKTIFKRLKHTENGWTVKEGKSRNLKELQDAFESFRIPLIREIVKKIGLSQFDGVNWWIPGIENYVDEQGQTRFLLHLKVRECHIPRHCEPVSEPEPVTQALRKGS